MPEFIKDCPVIGIQGNRILLGRPGKAVPYRNITRGQYRRVNNFIKDFKKLHGRGPSVEELAGVWAFIAPGMLAALPILLVGAVGIGSAFLASRAVERMRPFLSGMVPIGVTGVGLWGYGQVKQWLKPVREEYTSDREYLTAVSRQKIIDSGVIMAAAGGMLYGIYTWVSEYGKLKERDRITEEEKRKDPELGLGFIPSVAEQVDLQKKSELLKDGDILISEPKLTLVQWWGWVWQSFTLRIEFDIVNNSAYDIPYLYLDIEDLNYGYTAVKRNLGRMRPGETKPVSAMWTAHDSWTGANMQYAVPGKALLRLQIGTKPGSYFMRTDVDLVPKFAEPLKKYESYRWPGYGPTREPGPGVTRRG